MSCISLTISQLRSLNLSLPFALRSRGVTDEDIELAGNLFTGEAGSVSDMLMQLKVRQKI